MAKTLTGRTQYRASKPLFGQPLLVLQVEERSKGTSWGDPQDYVGRDYDTTYWRDATVEDLGVVYGTKDTERTDS